MEKYKNIVPFFLLVILVLIWIFVFIPKSEYILKFEDVEKVYTDDYNILGKYNDKVYKLLDNLKLTKGSMPGGVYRFLYIKDAKGTKTLYLFDNGAITYKKGNKYYSSNNKKLVDEIRNNVYLYSKEYLSKPLFSVEINKKHKLSATKTISQQDAKENIRFTFNREISNLKIIYKDKIEIPDTCYEEKKERICEYEYKDKVSTNEKYVLKENETLDFKFNKESYKYGLIFYITDFNGEVSKIEITINNDNIEASEIEVE